MNLRKKNSRNTVSLTLKSQHTIVEAIDQVAGDDLLAAVLEDVDDQLHIATFSSRSAFWKKLKVSDLLPNLCISLKSMYIAAYTKCGKGKDKYINFQLEWYRQ